jgi:hypothetical protein
MKTLCEGIAMGAVTLNAWRHLNLFVVFRKKKVFFLVLMKFFRKTPFLY